MFGRTERKEPLKREQLAQLEDLRDDCIALYLNSPMTQKDIWAAGGPTPGTITRWLYKETYFPRYETIERFLMALGFGLTPMPLSKIDGMRAVPIHERLGLDIEFLRRPKMPPKKKAGK